jgi:hypothetical protein
MGEEVIPALREIGDELGLDSPFDVNPATGKPFDETPSTPTNGTGHGAASMAAKTSENRTAESPE